MWKRKHIRLRGYDYSKSGMYFITICTKNMVCFFGEVVNGEMVLNGVGVRAEGDLKKLTDHYNHVRLGEYVVMPNHVHLILVLEEKYNEKSFIHNQFGKPIKGSVSMIVNQYKAGVKRWCNKNNLHEFLWQVRFNDHIIRNDVEYQNISFYIKNNPKNWIEDDFYF